MRMRTRWASDKSTTANPSVRCCTRALASWPSQQHAVASLVRAPRSSGSGACAPGLQLSNAINQLQRREHQISRALFDAIHGKRWADAATVDGRTVLGADPASQRLAAECVKAGVKCNHVSRIATHDFHNRADSNASDNRLLFKECAWILLCWSRPSSWASSRG